MRPTVATVHTWTPAVSALQVMGKAAHATADTYTLRQWAGRLAARAGPKDYLGQLQQLYAGVVGRWRYVMEHGEWVPGTPRTVLGQVLGLAYNAPHGADLEHVDVESMPATHKGWGDCDDVATLVASGVISLGMTPLWRVSRGPAGAHVAAAAITPARQLVVLDPVGHPKQGFGWQHAGPGVEVCYFSLDARPLGATVPHTVSPFGGAGMSSPAPSPYSHSSVAAMNQRQAPYAPQFMPQYMANQYSGWHDARQARGLGYDPLGYDPLGALGFSSTHFDPRVPQFYSMGFIPQPYDARAGLGYIPPAYDPGPTYLGVFSTLKNRKGFAPYQCKVRRHFVSVHPADRRGARVLAVPKRTARAFMRGMVMDGAEAVDQYGAAYTYHQGPDIWVPDADEVGFDGFGRMSKKQRKAKRKKRRKKRKVRRRKTLKKVGKFFKKVGKGIRKVGSALLKSKFVQTIVAGALQVFGIPMPVTKILMRVAGEFIGQGGIFKLIKTIKKSPKKGLAMLAKTVKAAGFSNILKKFKIPGFSGVDNYGAEPVIYEMEQSGQTYYAAPVEGIVGMPGVYELGAADVSPEPTGGYWYRVQRGDTLNGIAKRAYDGAWKKGAWMNAAVANAHYLGLSRNLFERKWYGVEILKLQPRWSSGPDAAQGARGGSLPLLWIPAHEGDEPPEALDPVTPDPPPDPGYDEAELEPDDPTPPVVPPPYIPPTDPSDLLPDPQDPPLPDAPPDPRPPMPPVGPVEPSEPVRPPPIPTWTETEEVMPGDYRIPGAIVPEGLPQDRVPSGPQIPDWGRRDRMPHTPHPEYGTRPQHPPPVYPVHRPADTRGDMSFAPLLAVAALLL